jgi:glycosyltransferase involved in cell wall biosynthesis
VALPVSRRILHVTPYFAPAFGYGGPPRSVLGLCRALQRAGCQVAVVTTSANGRAELPAEVTARGAFDGVPVVYLPRTFPKRHFRASSLRTWLDAHRNDYDLVHVHGCWNMFGWTGARWCRRAGVPYVVSPRGMLHPSSFAGDRLRKSIAYEAIERRTLGGARFVHVTSDEERTVVSALQATVPTVTVPNGVEVAEPPSSAETTAFRQRGGADASDFVLLYLGRLHPQKGLDRLLAAFRRALQAYPRVKLWLAGAGDPVYVARLRQEAHDLEQTGRLLFCGFVDGEDRRLSLASADAFVLTSYSENFGMGVAEAMAAGLPVIVSRECPWNQIEEWGAGFHVDNTPAAVADAIGRLATDRTAARQMGHHGRENVKRTLDWNVLAPQMVAAYESERWVH